MVNGYLLDTEAASISYRRDTVEEGEGARVHRLAEEPLEIGTSITGFPGNPEVALVRGHVPAAEDFLVAVVDEETVLLNCAVEGMPTRDDTGGAVLSPDGTVLLVPNLDDDDVLWIEAHSTINGEHLWSRQGASYTVDEQRAYVALGSTLTAVDLDTGETVWEEEPITHVDDRPRERSADDRSDTWDLRVVGDELYAYRHGGIRLLAFAVRDGRTSWDLIPGDNRATPVRITQATDDHVVVLSFGTEAAVRSPGQRSWAWLYRGVETSRVELILAPRSSSDAALIAVTPQDRHLDPVTVHTQSGESLISLMLPSDELTFELTDSVLYVLHKIDRTVTGYDLHTSEVLWSVDVPGDREFRPPFITAHDRGFRVHGSNGEFVSFSDRDPES
jgi:DNA-binding beta-propeller fold protein YncE